MNSILLTLQPVFSLFRITLMNVILKKWVKLFLFSIFIAGLKSRFYRHSQSVIHSERAEVPQHPWSGTALQLFPGPAISIHLLTAHRSAFGLSDLTLVSCTPSLFCTHTQQTTDFLSSELRAPLHCRRKFTLNQTWPPSSHSHLLGRANVTSQPIWKFFFTIHHVLKTFKLIHRSGNNF